MGKYAKRIIKKKTIKLQNPNSAFSLNGVALRTAAENSKKAKYATGTGIKSPSNVV